MKINLKGITGCFTGIFAITVVAVLVAVIVITAPNEDDAIHATDLTLEEVKNYIINNVDPGSIRKFLRNVTTRPHLAGTEGELELAKWIANTWKDQGFDEVHLVPYDVLLSYPSPDIPNLVRIVNDSSEAIWTSAAKQPPLYAPEEWSPEIPFTFNGYAAAANVTGDVVYAGYGRKEDYDFLTQEGISISGKIVIARYGEIFRANIVRMAEDRGAIGVVLYADPIDNAPEGPNFVYPDSMYMPPTATQLGSVFVEEGDPLTTFYPSVESAYRMPEEESDIPKIPVQPISYEDAWQILSRMRGDDAPSYWQGGMNLTYRLGPGFQDQKLRLNLDVNNENIIATTHNVIGVITGSVEPDRYVTLGNHYDAWNLGAMDPYSGTAAMLEFSRVLMQLSNETGWRPRRSLVFCAWGAEEYGLVGSMEWTEQFGKQLADRTLAYLNLDTAVAGNYSLSVRSAPLLYEIIYEATKQIPNPDPQEVSAGRKTVYDTWVLREPDPSNSSLPRMLSIGAGSDYKGFQHNLGIPSLDFSYDVDTNLTKGEPLYHTLYQTFALVDEIYDRGFLYHSAVTALWGSIAVVLSESKIIPFSLKSYPDYIKKAYGVIVKDYGDLFALRNITMDYFREAVTQFAESVENFTSKLEHVDLNNPLMVRKVNDQMMMVERAFIDPHGLPGRPRYNHVVTVPSNKNVYSATIFAGLTDILIEIIEAPEDQKDALWRTFSQHLAVVTHLTNTAAKVLTDQLW